MIEYYSRVVDSQLDFKLRSSGAVLIRGPKWCGKSTTAEQRAQSAVFMQDRQTSAQNIELAKNAPSLLLDGPTPRLIDEWQVIPFIWDQIRYEVDRRNGNGQFILTGSATPLADPDENEAAPYEHSGIGRISPLTMRTMSLFESRDGNGSVSLASLFQEQSSVAAQCDATLKDYAYLTCRGGWPRALDLDREAALEQAFVFYDGLVHEDINRVFRRAKNPERIKRFMRSYSRAVATETSLAEIRKDMAANDEATLSDETISLYISALEKLFVIENLPAWNPNLRSKTAVRTSETKHFVDPSIACAALGLGPNDLINDLETFGLLFESLCVRDLRVYAESLNGQVYHYRDKKGREADAVIHLRGGSWAPVEVKLANQERIEEAARNLLAFAADIDTAKIKPPSFLMVVTATGYAYRRSDGVYVVPLGCLRP
ncbi:ATP-binding protein [Adlercreutzia shanghongiae]|uniref:DUF4143 domain-containing protein n=1 Tax=Adlercreutzia shanghongiae TaxID=3111773 RepID=A0ABU6J1B2_9ACTN|nr:DUF4143 domain-containing protein [Adlercreutzia sp. R22]MEC4295932.1 DUF4143 domain-containing protein [Adlercreutzia sp. R22]